jgi:hypothetical protein
LESFYDGAGGEDGSSAGWDDRIPEWSYSFRWVHSQKAAVMIHSDLETWWQVEQLQHCSMIPWRIIWYHASDMGIVSTFTNFACVLE